MLAGTETPEGEGLGSFWAPLVTWDGRKRYSYMIEKEKRSAGNAGVLKRSTRL